MADFDEKHPYGKPNKFSTIVAITGDNIEFSRERYNAMRAVRMGQATPQQRALIAETDETIHKILGEE